MKVLFVVEKRSKYAGTSVYSNYIVSELAKLVQTCETFVLCDRGDWPRELRTQILRTQPDIIQVLYARPSVVFRIGFILRDLDTPKVLSIHNIPPHESRIRCFYNLPRWYFFIRNQRYFYSRLFLMAGVRYYDRLLTFSEATERELQTWAIGKVHRIPEGIPIDCNGSSSSARESSPPDTSSAEVRTPIVLTTAAFIFHKGIHRIIRLLPSLISEYPRLQYIVAGKERDPAYLRYIQRMVRRRRLDDYVQLVPNADGATLMKLYREYDVYVQPSYEEGFCLTFLEALWAKRASRQPFVILGGTVGEIPAFMGLAGMSRFVFDARSDSSLEQAVRFGLREARDRIVPHVQWEHILETYSWARAARETLKVYQLARAQANMA